MRRNRERRGGGKPYYDRRTPYDRGRVPNRDGIQPLYGKNRRKKAAAIMIKAGRYMVYVIIRLNLIRQVSLTAPIL